MVDPPESYDKGDPIAGIGFKRIIGGGNEEELQVEKPSSAGPAAALMHAVTGADQSGAWPHLSCTAPWRATGCADACSISTALWCDPSYTNYAGALYHVTDFYRNRTPHVRDIVASPGRMCARVTLASQRGLLCRRSITRRTTCTYSPDTRSPPCGKAARRQGGRAQAPSRQCRWSSASRSPPPLRRTSGR